MRNIIKLLTVVIAATVFSCQKDFEDEYLLEAQIITLQDENEEQALLIEHLQDIINRITGKLDDANRNIALLEDHLAIANDSIQLLNVDIDNLYSLVDRKEEIIDSLLQLEATNQATIDVLNAEVNSLNESIETVEQLANQYASDLEYLRNNPITITVVEYVTRVQEKVIVETRVVTETIMVEVPATPVSEVASPVVEIESTPDTGVVSPVEVIVDTPDTGVTSDTGVGNGDEDEDENDTSCEADYDQTFYSDNLYTEVAVLFDCNEDWSVWKLSWITDGTLHSTTVDRGDVFRVPWNVIHEDGSLAWISFLDPNNDTISFIDEFQLEKLF